MIYRPHYNPFSSSPAPGLVKTRCYTCMCVCLSCDHGFLFSDWLDWVLGGVPGLGLAEHLLRYMMVRSSRYFNNHPRRFVRWNVLSLWKFTKEHIYHCLDARLWNALYFGQLNSKWIPLQPVVNSVLSNFFIRSFVCSFFSWGFRIVSCSCVRTKHKTLASSRDFLKNIKARLFAAWFVATLSVCRCCVC